MREVVGDLWNYPVVVITTNGDVNKFGEAVMGRGVALQAKQKYPGIETYLGTLSREFGNFPFCLYQSDGRVILTLPVKYHWKEKADLKLIEKSIVVLVDMVDSMKLKSVAIPRPGCGNGKLQWDEVKPVIEPYLDDRFLVVNND